MVTEPVKPESNDPALLFLNTDLVHLLQQVPAAISILVGPDYIIQTANDKALEVWGKTKVDVIGKPTFEAFPELIEQGFKTILDGVYTTGKRFVANEALVQLVRGGRMQALYFNFSYDPYYNQKGEIIGLINTGTEVTEVVTAKQQIAESNERSRMAIESTEMGTWDYNPATDTILCDDRTKELFGFSPNDEVNLEKAVGAIVDKDRERVVKAIQHAMTPESGGHYDMEYSLVNYHDQSIRTIRAKGRAFFEGGTVTRFIGTALDITGEVRAKEEQQKLVTLVDNSLELMSILELNGTNSYLNKAGRELLGFDSEEQVLSTPISELHTPEDVAFVEANVLPGVMTTGKWSGVMNVRHLKTKEVFPVFNNTVRIDDPITSKPIAIGAVMRDMRPELAIQKTLAESESKLRNVIEQAPSPILILKGEDMVLEVANQALFDLWRVDKGAIGKTFLQILPEMESQGFLELLRKVYHTKEPFYGYEVPALFYRANGEEELVYFNFVYQPYRELDGEVSGVLVIATDVTSQVIAQRKLVKSEATLTLAVEAAQFGVYELDMLEQKITHSPRAAEIFGLDPGKQWPFSSFTNAVHPEDVAIRTKAHEKAVHTGSLFYEIRIYCPDRTLRWVRLNGKVMVQDGKAVSSVGTIMDITEEKLAAELLEEKIRQRTLELQVANEHLERSNEQLEQFAHVASHDMKEPVRKIGIFSDRLKADLQDIANPQITRYIDKIELSTRRLNQMIEGVLSYASLSAHQEQWEMVDLKEVVQNIESDLELVIQQKETKVVYTDLPRIYAAPFLVYQLFYNLINNSLKFIAPGKPPVITIQSHRIQEVEWYGYTLDTALHYWEISLSDNGIGFSNDHAERIFKTFIRLHSKDQYEGTGLGLSLCRSIVEKHHGFIKAFGKEGEGAEFKILLPELKP